jgi:hypothetical protein
MAYTVWSQDIFSKGELSPYMYARATVNEYGNGLKTAQNILTYPTGAAGKRFGTLYLNTLTNLTTYKELYFNTFQYLNECVYQMVFTPGQLAIYLEGLLTATITGINVNPNEVYNLSTTVLGAVFRCATSDTRPFEILRSSNSPVNVTANTTTTFTCAAAPFVANMIYPVKFNVTGGTIIQTSPQLSAGVTYFVATVSTTTAVLFFNSIDAKEFLINPTDFTNAFTITGSGTGTTTCAVQNTWGSFNTPLKNVPVFDFNSAVTSYDNLTFTPSATTGTGVTITVSAAYSPLNTDYIGGAFIGAGGTSRITAVASTTSFTVSVQDPFSSTAAIQGSLAFLAEPAWSNTRGWPQVCSSYQNRALYANTMSLPNGFYASVINDYSDFGDLTTDDDDAISWYPASDNVNFIRFIVPYRSLTVHTNTGIYSSPLSDLSAITPNNFTLQLQDSTPANSLLPQAIDNQVLVISGNDAHQMLWDGINNAYTSNIVSVISEQTIKSPVDEVSFNDLHHAGSRYVFIINADGSMSLFQTLISQSVSGFTPQIMEQSYGNASFIQAASSSDGRAWFVVEREIATAASPIAITNYTATTLYAVASNFSTTTPTAIKFTTTGTLPTADPEITTTNYFWAIGIDADNFEVFSTQNDALDSENAITFTNSGTSSNVVSWPLSSIFTLEQLTKDVKLDCAIKYSGSATSTVTTGNLFNAQDIKMVGDGFGFNSAAEDNINNEVNFISHGMETEISEAYIGFPINAIMEPMPLSLAMGNSAKETTLTKPKRVMFVRFMFNNTIGGTINDVPIALNAFDMANIGEPPFPARGIFEMSIMKGWDDFNNPTYTIMHDEPFDIQLLGVFYSLEI